MNLGTPFQKIQPHKVLVDFVLDKIPEYSYNDVIPKQYLTGRPVIDQAIAMLILYAHGYVTEWELKQVAIHIKKINPHLLFEVMRICREIGARKYG